MMTTARVRGRTYTNKWGARGAFATAAALAMLPVLATPASAGGAYVFTKVVDSAADGFNPNTLGISCPSINTRGDIAFKSDRGAVEGIYRANAVGERLTTIAEAPGSEFTLLTNENPSMNDSGQVSFGAIRSDDEQVVMRGDGTAGNLTTIASTGTEQGFTSFDYTSINDNGEVAFNGRLGAVSPRGLFSGTGGPTTTHYLDTLDVSVDGIPNRRFTATEDRPSINDAGDIAFLDQIQGDFDQHIFKGQEESFTTISASDPPLAGLPPLLNDAGTVAWQSFFSDESGFFASAIVTGDGAGTATRVVDSSGAFDVFHSYSMNNAGAVAFSATLDDDQLGTPSIYAGPSPKKDRVIGPGDKLDGGTVVGLSFCEEGLNDSGQLAFAAEIEDRNGEVRAGVFRATLRK